MSSRRFGTWRMPWKETQKMDQRMEFVLKAVSSPNFRELYREYGISAKTGYKWRERFLQHGLAGLNELSRRPQRHGDELSEAVGCEMVRRKQAHPHWGSAQDPRALCAATRSRGSQRKQFQARAGTGRFDRAAAR